MKENNILLGDRTFDLRDAQEIFLYSEYKYIKDIGYDEFLRNCLNSIHSKVVIRFKYKRDSIRFQRMNKAHIANVIVDCSSFEKKYTYYTMNEYVFYDIKELIVDFDCQYDERPVKNSLSETDIDKLIVEYIASYYDDSDLLKASIDAMIEVIERKKLAIE